MENSLMNGYRLKTSALFLALLIIADAAQAGPTDSVAEPKCPEQLIIKTPQPGQIVSSSVSLTIQGEFTSEEPLWFSALATQIYAFSLHDGSRIEIAAGDLRSFGDAGALLIEAFWPLQDVAAGNYLIVVELNVAETDRKRCESLTAEVPMQVNRAPAVAEIALISCKEVAGGKEVTLEARVNDYEGDLINQYLWNPGDSDDDNSQWVLGSNLWTHVYTSDVTGTMVNLLVYDTYGSVLVSQPLSIERCALIGAPAPVKFAGAYFCTADRMTIKSTLGDSEPYCHPQGHEIPTVNCSALANDQLPPAQRCPQGEFPMRCRLGPISPHGPILIRGLKWGFEVLTNVLGDPARCTMAQLAKGTIEASLPIEGRHIRVRNPNPATQPQPTAAFSGFSDWGFQVTNNIYPQFDDANRMLFGADGTDFIWPTLPVQQRAPFRKRIDNVWQLHDAPGMQLDPGVQVEWITQRAEFISYATGNFGPAASAWCRFAIEQGVNATRRTDALGGTSAPSSVTALEGWNCRIDWNTLEPIPLNRWIRRSNQRNQAPLLSNPFAVVGTDYSLIEDTTPLLNGYRLGFNNHQRAPDLSLRYGAFLADAGFTSGWVGQAMVNEGQVSGDPLDRAGGMRPLVGFNVELLGAAADRYDIFYKGVHHQGYTPTCVGGHRTQPCGLGWYGNSRPNPPLRGMQTWVQRRTTHVRMDIETGSDFGDFFTRPIHFARGPQSADYVINRIMVRFALPAPAGLGLRYSGVNSRECDLNWRLLGTWLRAFDAVNPTGRCAETSVDFTQLRFELTGTEAQNYDVFYEVLSGNGHTTDDRNNWSWSGLCRNGELCGNWKQIRAIRMWIVRK